MKPRRRDSKTKTKIILEGLSGRPVSEICNDYGIQQAFTSYNNPKGNADTERMIRTMKEELFWLREWEGERELGYELDKWVDYYNRSYLHSAHGYCTPVQVEEEYCRNHDSQLNVF